MDPLLIVDGESDVRALLSRVLPGSCRVLASADEGLSALEELPLPFVVLADRHACLDSGELFVHAVRRRFGPAPALVGLEPSFDFEGEPRAEAPLDACLRKPLTDVDLLRRTLEWAALCARRRGSGNSSGEESLARPAAPAILDHTEDAVLLVDRAGTVVMLNPAALRLLRLEPHATLGRPLLELDLDPALRSLLAQGPAFPGSCLRLSDRRRALEVSRYAAGPDGERGSFVVLREVTAALRGAQLQRRYLTVVSHELRTPLTVLGNLLTVLAASAQSASTREHCIGGMQYQVLRLSHQVDRLLLLASMEQQLSVPHPEPFDAATSLEEAIVACRLQAGEQGLDFRVAGLEDEVFGRGAEDDFRRAVYELVENAVKFTPPGGRVEVALEQDEQEVLVRVVDTGIGIDPRDHAAIFDEFRQLEEPVTRTYGGSGLGLALAQRMVERWGGRIRVSSEAGRGSAFVLSIPRGERPVIPGGKMECGASTEEITSG